MAVYFADTELFTVWGEYDGTLPAQYTANGDYLADYRIYGSAGGVGDDSGTAYGYEVDLSVQSENLFDQSDATPDYRYDDNGNWIKDNGVLSSGSMKIAAGDKYEYKFKTVWLKNNGICRINFLDANGQWLSVNKVSFNAAVGDIVTISGNAPTGTAFIRTSQYSGEQNISMTVVAGTTPIYIGSDPLGEDEYISYGEQKVYRRTEQLYNPSTALKDKYIIPSIGGIDQRDGYELSDYIDVNGATEVTISSMVGETISGKYGCHLNVYDANKKWLRGDTTYAAYPANTQKKGTYDVTDVAYIRVDFGVKYLFDNSVVVGATAPQTYIPYYDPQDPPVPLPALPTVDGTNIVDYAGQSAAVPERFIAKYRKEGFR